MLYRHFRSLSILGRILETRMMKKQNLHFGLFFVGDKKLLQDSVPLFIVEYNREKRTESLVEKWSLLHTVNLARSYRYRTN